ncbi:helix-turn-helix domain-containing protein [Hymenobacter sp. ISL-91]|uniref:helix-turn-helix domain-containing protein n=1 Tax=Hymenobacter sp. ISL-91 TaxID=2819151 RepID=UPI001BEB176D|nr:helix-turn-helix domain-containing protein [Hymenobacter sp. ISL-91]MBT2559236.1 helix-turn-helix domain-containing protein [Hymenobacter sp. ISL-91]
MILAPLPLTALEITTLEAACARGPHPRMRRRAQAVLGHHRGASISSLATLFGVQYNTLSQWLRNWRRHGLAGLAEAGRSGRPTKLPSAVKKK